MNNGQIVNIEGGEVTREVQRILRDVPGVQVLVESTLPDSRRPDLVIRAGDVTHVVEIKTQRQTNAASAHQLAEYARQLPGEVHLLLIAQSTTEEARRILEGEGVAVIDGLGNIRVKLPGMFLWTEGRKPPKAAGPAGQPPARLTGRAGVAAQALLADPGRKWRVNDLAAEAQISSALAHRVLTRLERENLVAAEGAGPHRVRHITNPAALLDLWAEEMRDRRVKEIRAFRLARNPRDQVGAVDKALNNAQIDHAVTGAAAAAQLAPFITAIPVTHVWVTETIPLEVAVNAVGAEQVTEGHNLLLRQVVGDEALAFRKRVDDIWLANPFRIFLDLHRDPRRGREQADRLREEVIGF